MKEAGLIHRGTGWGNCAIEAKDWKSNNGNNWHVKSTNDYLPTLLFFTIIQASQNAIAIVLEGFFFLC